MPDAVVLGAAGTSGERLARRLADCLRSACSTGRVEPATGVWLSWPPGEAAARAPLVAFIDDGAKEHAARRAEALAVLVGARSAFFYPKGPLLPGPAR
jgi:hypothetical protein